MLTEYAFTTENDHLLVQSQQTLYNVSKKCQTKMCVSGVGEIRVHDKLFLHLKSKFLCMERVCEISEIFINLWYCDLERSDRAVEGLF